MDMAKPCPFIFIGEVPNRLLSGFDTPNQNSITIKRHLCPIRKRKLGRIERVIAGFGIVAPICFVEADLDLTTLPTRRDRTCSCRETNFDVEVCAGTSWIHLHKQIGYVAASTRDCGKVAVKRLTLRSFARVPIADLQLAEWYCCATYVNDVEVRLDLVITGIGIRGAILKFERACAAGWSLCSSWGSCPRGCSGWSIRCAGWRKCRCVRGRWCTCGCERGARWCIRASRRTSRCERGAARRVGTCGCSTYGIGGSAGCV